MSEDLLARCRVLVAAVFENESHAEKCGWYITPGVCICDRQKRIERRIAKMLAHGLSLLPRNQPDGILRTMAEEVGSG